jgi:hypothetical protein
VFGVNWFWVSRAGQLRFEAGSFLLCACEGSALSRSVKFLGKAGMPTRRGQCGGGIGNRTRISCDDSQASASQPRNHSCVMITDS